MAPKCPWKDTPGGDRGPAPLERVKARMPTYSSISISTPVLDQKAERLKIEETESDCEQSLSATLDMGGLFLVSKDESVVVLDTGATANLVCFQHHNRLLGRSGLQRVSTYPSKARSRFGGGRLGEESHAADIPAGIAGNKGKFAAFALDADIPALLREGAAEESGSQLDVSRDPLVLLKQGVTIPHACEQDGALYPESCRFRRGRIEEGAWPCGFGRFS